MSGLLAKRRFGKSMRGAARTGKDIYFKKLSHFPCKNFHAGKPCSASQGTPAASAAFPMVAQARRSSDGEEELQFDE
ncbi:MAG: hypothetical protein I8H94_06120 [Rhodobacteraceae bacterium]|nr:hypothetical protein [Paracoccaceae bacterium]